MLDPNIERAPEVPEEDLFDLMDPSYLEGPVDPDEMYDDEYGADEWYDRAENEDFIAQYEL